VASEVRTLVDSNVLLYVVTDDATWGQWSADALGDAGIAVDDIGLRQPTLDDVFLTLTGRATSEDAQPETAEATR